MKFQLRSRLLIVLDRARATLDFAQKIGRTHKRLAAKRE
jgi:hypothetical protein